MRSKLTALLIGFFLFGNLSLPAQNKTLRGNVIGEDDGQPVVGAFVTIEP